MVFALFTTFGSSSQVTVGSYTGANGNSYQLLIDGMRFRIPNDQLSKSQKKNIYLQMEVEPLTPHVKTHLRLKKKEALKMIGQISDAYVKAQKLTQKANKQRTQIGKGGAFLSYVKDNPSSGSVFGWEQNNRYSIMYDYAGYDPLVIFEGQASQSEGDVPVSINGWKITISSPQQANDIIQLLMKGVNEMERIIKNK